MFRSHSTDSLTIGPLATQFLLTSQDSKLLEKLGAPSKLTDYVNKNNDFEGLDYPEIKNWYDTSILSKFSENYRDRASNIESLSDVFEILNPSNNPGLQENMKKLAPDTIPEFHCVLSFSDPQHPESTNFRTINFSQEGDNTRKKDIDLLSKNSDDIVLAINTGHFFQACYKAKKAVEELIAELAKLKETAAPDQTTYTI